MSIQQSRPLKALNTFGLPAKAAYFAEVQTVEELRAVLQTPVRPIRILGGGSNILLTKDVDGLVIRNRIGGIRIEHSGLQHSIVEAGGGVNWHDLVCWALDRDLGGIENLSLIPGSTGAAPIQNIGAYGVELKDVFDRLEAIELATGKSRTFTGEDCHFGYRDSIFKGQLKGKYCIIRVYLRLTNPPHTPNTRYGAIRQILEESGIFTPTIRDISNAVIRIRQSKLPDPTVIGNAGSFFKNPEVDATIYEELTRIFPDIPAYDLPDGRKKIPAGWLIEATGWKGKRIGDAGCHAQQALVMVNYGDASGQEILQLAESIRKAVEKQFGIVLEREVNVW